MTVDALKIHLALNVADIEKSTEFYQKLLGLQPSRVRPGYAKFDVINPPVNLALNERPGSSHGSLSHLGIQLSSTDDVLATRARWVDNGLEVRDEMKTDCCGALQDKTWVSDPDGNQWEAFVVLQSDTQSGSQKATNCCA